MPVSTFTVKHLDCQSCAMVMEGICEDLPGVIKAEVKVAQRRLIVEHDDTVKPDDVQAALDREGYPVSPAVPGQ